MGTYYIPRNVKGETRILYIFTIKALITTIAGTMIGLLFLFIFSMVGLKVVGIVITVILALLGYGIGMIKIPTLAGLPVTKKIGGDPLSEIILKFFKFKKNRKKYTYIKIEEEEDT